MRGTSTFVVLVFGAWAMAADAPAKRPFVVSTETTVVLGPVRADGTVDYVAALNERGAAGVTRDQNAAVALLEVIGKGKPKDAIVLAKARSMMGLPEAGERAPYQSFEAFAEVKAAKSADFDARAAQEEYSRAGDHGAWKPADAPVVAEWLTSVGGPSTDSSRRRRGRSSTSRSCRRASRRRCSAHNTRTGITSGTR
jgi:hypothetical protein